MISLSSRRSCSAALPANGASSANSPGHSQGVRSSFQRCRQVGNICMDQCMFEVDLRSYARRRRVDPQVGDEVLIVGQQGDAMVTIEEMCETLNTIPHELCIGFAQRMPRYYV